jgi:5-methylcytosine-specific restriction endonuclease McrA
MKAKIRQDKASLLATARAIAEMLRQQCEGTRLRVRIPGRATTMDTDGWAAVVGDLGKSQPRLEIWLDRFAGYPERKLYAGFWSEVTPQIASLTKLVSRKLWPARVITPAHISDEKFFVLTDRLDPSDFNTPILEKYPGGAYFGIFDVTRPTTERVSPHFCNRAVAFFEDVVRALPSAKIEDEQRDVYPQYENRKRVASHIQRERSRLLATERKIRDNYECQVCGMRFEKVYGPKLGRGFAEAHHLVPLGHLRSRIIARVEDLRTVCANCHRMLHRMSGKRDDIERLRIIVRKSRQRRK